VVGIHLLKLVDKRLKVGKHTHWRQPVLYLKVSSYQKA